MEINQRQKKTEKRKIFDLMLLRVHRHVITLSFSLWLVHLPINIYRETTRIQITEGTEHDSRCYKTSRENVTSLKMGHCQGCISGTRHSRIRGYKHTAVSAVH